jgi:hypothetical protein
MLVVHMDADTDYFLTTEGKLNRFGNGIHNIKRKHIGM